ncbi:MAG: hypothetical protein K8I60_14730, partial [Anaerolineae bacterium]|nr:hypothetical protein [Anaerolineae bacterium]
VTHDQQEAIFMGDRIIVMRSGRVEQFDTFDALYYTPANLFVASLIGTPPISILPLDLGGDLLRLPDGTSWSLPHDLMNTLPGGAVRLGVRPEGWIVSKDADTSIPMKVTHIERLYTERAAFVHGYLAGAAINALVPLDFPEVSQVFLQPDWERAYFFHATEETPLRLPGIPELF